MRIHQKYVQTHEKGESNIYVIQIEFELILKFDSVFNFPVVTSPPQTSTAKNTKRAILTCKGRRSETRNLLTASKLKQLDLKSFSRFGRNYL
jgi:hypothetical protein